MKRRSQLKPVPCPACGSCLSRVIDVRPFPDTVQDQLQWFGHGLWRRRRCMNIDCGATFTTEEIVRRLDILRPTSSGRTVRVAHTQADDC